VLQTVVMSGRSRESKFGGRTLEPPATFLKNAEYRYDFKDGEWVKREGPCLNTFKLNGVLFRIEDDEYVELWYRT
jgi:hypothetical protein